MSRGLYSVVRYSNNLNDQRVNLGVLVWHPVDGFQVRFARSLGRVHAVNARANLTELEEELQEIERELISHPKKDGSILAQLSCRYKNGVEVSDPYPARMYSLAYLSDRLYEMLVTSREELSKPRFQTRLQDSFRRAIHAATRFASAPGYSVTEVGRRAVNDVQVDLGIEVKLGSVSSLWHALALQFSTHASGQVAKAKATAMEIATIRQQMPAYQTTPQLVALQALEATHEHRGVAEAWLKQAGADVISVEDEAELPGLVKDKLRQIYPA